MIHEGQKLWMVYRDQRLGEPREITITKIGRRWADTDVYRVRVDVNTLEVAHEQRGFSSPAQCYVSREAYEAETALRKAWDDFAHSIAIDIPPAGMTIERINELRREFRHNTPPAGEVKP